jgi:hypothetical protein
VGGHICKKACADSSHQPLSTVATAGWLTVTGLAVGALLAIAGLSREIRRVMVRIRPATVR